MTRLLLLERLVALQVGDLAGRLIGVKLLSTIGIGLAGVDDDPPRRVPNRRQNRLDLAFDDRIEGLADERAGAGLSAHPNGWLVSALAEPFLTPK